MHTMIVGMEPGAELPSFKHLHVKYCYTSFPGCLVSASDPVRALLAQLPGVRGIYPDDPLERHLDLAGASTGFAERDVVAETGRGVTVAVIDVDIDTSHPGFGSRVSRYAVTGSGVEASDTAVSDRGHGTHVIGVLAGDGTGSPAERYRGVAPSSRVIGLDLGASFTTDAALRAFDWVHANHEAHGIRIVTNSWGRAGDVDGRFDPDAPLVRATDTLAVEDGLIVIFSAGNRGSANGISTEALNPNVITVGAVDAGARLASFSSRGPGLDAIGAPIRWTKPDVVAVGDDVVSPKPLFTSGTPASAADRSLAPTLYSSVSGTSYAAPMVAGVAALMLEADPTLTREAVMAVLTATARDLEEAGPDPRTGAGLVDARAALDLVRAGALAGGISERVTTVSYDSTVVAAAGVLTKVLPSPSFAVGGELVGYLPVLPGTTRLSARVDWSATGLASIDARLMRPDGTVAGGLQQDGAGLRLDVDAPMPGIWRVIATPGIGFFQASITLAGDAHLTRTMPTVATIASLVPVAPASPIGLAENTENPIVDAETPGASVALLLGIVLIVALALPMIRRH